MSDRDLIFTRDVPLPPEALWRAWTEPTLLTRWFCPRPWQATEAEIDLRPGGIFRTVMQGPAGERHDHLGCWLEAVPHQRLAWTDCLLPGFRPAAKPFVSVVLTFEPLGAVTRYTALAMHPDAETCAQHAAMGFQDGWGKALDQLVEVMRS
jgi:uncharacterized protein YndB with AHSA1/START domain